ncbi:hypothetical protein VP01_3482g5 [Puccinia sorghi]|uniref:Uncharacterized protein n=1 Tax=Puccinia sorghi TaxID=27349 RepID=A0A0L6UVV0_9BASI|nr:hypothetical protein VP01_3482g5 [Puccinia sorghi]
MNILTHTDDLDSQNLDVETFLSFMIEIHQKTKGHSFGYRKIKQILQTMFGIPFHNMAFALINKTLDPVGVYNRSKRILKQISFKKPGSNFIWSADGHEKLKKFGLMLWKFFSYFIHSHKILGIYFNVTKNDPCHIGYYYLQLVRLCGGILSSGY